MSVSFGVNELRGKNWINFLGGKGRPGWAECIPLAHCQSQSGSLDIQTQPLHWNNNISSVSTSSHLLVYCLPCLCDLSLSKPSRQWQWNGSWVHAGAGAGAGPYQARLQFNSSLLTPLVIGAFPSTRYYNLYNLSPVRVLTKTLPYSNLELAWYCQC